MGYQEVLFKTNKENMAALENFIELNKWEIENPPLDYCFVPSTILFKKDVAGKTVYSEQSDTFKAGEKYFWATGQRGAVHWLAELFDSYGFDTEGVHIEYVPLIAFEGFKEFISKFKEHANRTPFENEYVIIEPIHYV